MSTRQYDNFNDLVTFTRSSGGTALRPISYGPELVTNGTFDTDLSGWTEDASGVVTWSDGVALVGNGNGVSNTYFSQTVSAVSGKTYEIKVGVNLLSGAGVRIIVDGVNQGGGGYFTSDQTFYYTATSSTIDVEIYRFRNHTGSVEIDNISVKEVLFDQAGAPLTLFNHLTDTPRIEYDADGNVLGLLVEEARTNLFAHSDMDVGWIKTEPTPSFTKDYAIGPDGNQNAWRFNPTFLTDPGTSALVIRLYSSISSLSGDILSFSVFVKPVVSTSAYPNDPDGGGTVERPVYAALVADQSAGQAYFNLNTLTVDSITGSQISSTFIEPFGDGWYRIGITYNVENDDISNNHFLLFSNRTTTSFDPHPDGNEDIYFGYAQLEAGAFPTSYIPTSGATATRSADVASIPVADFGYNQSEGTALIEFSLSESFVSVGFPSVIMFYRDGLNRFGLTTALNSDDFRFNGLDSNVGQFDLSKTTNSTGETQKHIFGFEDNLFRYVVDGDTPSVDSSGTLPDVAEIVIGASSPSSGYMNCYIKSIKYYPRRLTNAQLQELTT